MNILIWSYPQCTWKWMKESFQVVQRQNGLDLQLRKCRSRTKKRTWRCYQGWVLFSLRCCWDMSACCACFFLEDKRDFSRFLFKMLNYSEIKNFFYENKTNHFSWNVFFFSICFICCPVFGALYFSTRGPGSGVWLHLAPEVILPSRLDTFDLQLCQD